MFTTGTVRSWSIVLFLLAAASLLIAGCGDDDGDDPTVPPPAPFVSEASSFGDGTITRDTATNLGWLDVMLSTPYSYDTLLPELGAGGEFEDYRLATRDEVKTLWFNAGIDTTLAGFVDDNLEPIVDLMSFVGITGDNGNLGGGNLFDFTAGHIESGPGGGGYVFVATIAADPDPTATGRQSVGTVPSDNVSSWHGAWLIEK